jgi:hypothetical protein
MSGFKYSLGQSPHDLTLSVTDSQIDPEIYFTELGISWHSQIDNQGWTSQVHLLPTWHTNTSP